MKNAVKNIFGMTVAGALAAIPLAAYAEDAAVPANANSVSVQQPIFASMDGRERPISFVEEGAAAASHDKIAIIIWGGNHELQREAYLAARELNSEGVDLALILGPPLGTGDRAVNIQVYARSVPVFEGSGALIGINNIDEVAPTVMEMGRTAQARHFTQRVASLDLAQD